ncbi:NAD-dependent epimerase/dehydratase [Penicillium robsamsonii]|uniref:NAD-dependent epimerase/dehydratase n=1 Tax=Penicillium robsamsonii TaxID=1792511 RepID=UPI0025488C5D|nr:NAD-dependent epimerase/dehydratase [Penicillium robsamsonii]KAJ5822549.1 NAD-dependent epimerase/dehydratase [Penicillium robsamsonii]
MSYKAHDISCEHLLITGVTGYIGFKTLTIALERGYRVRAVVRNERNINELKNKSTRIAQSLDQEQLQFVVIPNFLESDAIFKVLGGITVIIHLASPLAIETDDYDIGIVKPAISMVTTVLEAATRVTSIRRVVLTSSCVTLIPFEWNINPDSKRLYTGQSSTPSIYSCMPAHNVFRLSVDDVNTSVTGPFSTAMEAYWASKALARVATKAFVNHAHPIFDFVNLLPSVVIGPDDRLDADPTATVNSLLQGTRAAVLAPALTSSLNSSFPYVGTPVHVADVARAHVDAVDDSLVPGNSEYILSSDTPNGVVWDRDVQDACRKFFPEEVTSKRFPLEGSLAAIKWRLSARQAEETFGWQFTDFEETVRQLLLQYLQLKERSGMKF